MQTGPIVSGRNTAVQCHTTVYIVCTLDQENHGAAIFGEAGTQEVRDVNLNLNKGGGKQCLSVLWASVWLLRMRKKESGTHARKRGEEDTWMFKGRVFVPLVLLSARPVRRRRSGETTEEERNMTRERRNYAAWLES